MPDELLDVKQVQDKLKISERTVFRLIKNGELRGFKVGREWRFEPSDIEDYIRRQREKAIIAQGASRELA
jgi:excisionase family DNA binding protein